MSTDQDNICGFCGVDPSLTPHESACPEYDEGDQDEVIAALRARLGEAERKFRNADAEWTRWHKLALENGTALDAARARAEKAEGALRTIIAEADTEWENGCQRCAYCGKTVENGHYSDCPIARARAALGDGG
jgi:hypothetical protein